MSGSLCRRVRECGWATMARSHRDPHSDQVGCRRVREGLGGQLDGGVRVTCPPEEEYCGSGRRAGRTGPGTRPSSAAIRAATRRQDGSRGGGRVEPCRSPWGIRRARHGPGRRSCYRRSAGTSHQTARPRSAATARTGPAQDIHPDQAQHRVDGLADEQPRHREPRLADPKHLPARRATPSTGEPPTPLPASS